MVENKETLGDLCVLDAEKNAAGTVAACYGFNRRKVG
jgi:hypothetical protein